ncbi:sterol desaturase family protein [Erwinia oleae]|uniref:sterol desaturase family protein n=1 Tax=Erwinia oleae TaxID=796334 RepID=UPI00054E95FF|nr:sterol desaturase family protein [Erwinia oleae]
MLIFYNALIVLMTIIGMEIIAALAHKYLMHGWGWGWHRSHHEPRHGALEVNDLYAAVFAVLAIALIWFGTEGAWPLQWIGAGMTAYGALYFMVHDGLVHQRWPFRYIPRRGYLKRLYMAHRLHHAVRGKEGCVSFGFLYAPPVAKLQKTLRERHGRPGKAAASDRQAH